MKAVDLIFRETLTEGQFEMKSHVLVFIDEMRVDVDTQLMTDMENQILQSYRYNSAGRVEHNGWL